MLKHILTESGLTLAQAIMATPVLLSLFGVFFKILKTPFKVIDIISVNKFVSLPLQEKIDAISMVYQNDDLDKTSIYIRELKLSEYGLHYPVATLRIMFDYLHSLGQLSISTRANDFLKNRKMFIIDDNNLPQLFGWGMVSTLIMSSTLLFLCSSGFAIGIKALMDTLHSVPGWASGIQLVLFLFAEVVLFIMIITMVAEVGSVFKAKFFARSLQNFNQEQLYKKYRN